MSERWIYGYRSTGFRELSDSEKGRIRRARLARFWMVVPVPVAWFVAVASGIGGIVFLTGGVWLGVAACVAICVSMGYSLNVMSNRYKVCRLGRLALMRRNIESFEYVGPDDAVRLAHQKAPSNIIHEEDDGIYLTPFWEREANILDALGIQSRTETPPFDIIAGEGVVIMVNGHLAKRVTNVEVVTVDRE